MGFVKNHFGKFKSARQLKLLRLLYLRNGTANGFLQKKIWYYNFIFVKTSSFFMQRRSNFSVERLEGNLCELFASFQKTFIELILKVSSNF